MKIIIVSLLSVLCSICCAQNNIEGKWQAVDDKDGQPSSHIDIAIEDGSLTATITKVYDVDEDTLCDLCPGDQKDQPLIGLEIISGMKQSGSVWKGGRILDPENGKTYKCKLELEGTDVLKVRGYIGIPALGRTQRWYRVAP